MSVIFSSGNALLLLVALNLLFTRIQAAESSWAKLQVSSDIITSMPHGNYRINVYEHSKNHVSDANRKRYFYAPLALLDHQNTTSQYNKVTKKNEFSFRIEMWNDRVNKKVADYLKNHVDNQTEPHQVQIIPFEKVILAKTTPSTTYSLSPNWQSYQSEKTLMFTLTCDSIKDCDELQQVMREDPTKFGHIKLSFSLTSEMSQFKSTTINLESITSGEMANKLIQRTNRANNQVLLTAEDENKLLYEMTSNIIVESIDDSDVIAPRSETQIYNILRDMLASSSVTISKLDDVIWESVFWNEENYRPDKTAKTLNEIYKKQDEDTKLKMIEAFTDNHKDSRKGLDNIGTLVTFEKNDGGISTEESFEKLYDESKNYVEWNGEAFTPKPLKLRKINVGNLRVKNSFKDRSVKIRYAKAVLSTPIHFVNVSGLAIFNQLDEQEEKIAVMNALIKDIWTNHVTELRKITDTLIEKIDGLSHSFSSTQSTVVSTKNKLDQLEKAIATIEEDVKNKLPKLVSDDLGTVNANITNEREPRSRPTPEHRKINGLQKEVKEYRNSSLSFSARRGTSDYKTEDSFITYDLIEVNQENCLEKKTGIFKAPFQGTYLFTFNAISGANGVTHVLLCKNNKYGSCQSFNRGTTTAYHTNLALTAIWPLNVNDTVGVMLIEGALHDDSSTTFCGVLLGKN